MTDFLHLSDLCERAEGPDRELDALIHTALNGDFHHLSLPPYSKSLDAALSLVPEGWLVDYTQQHLEGYASAGLYKEGHFVLVYERVAASGKTIALALCSAALRALHKDRGE